MAEEKTSIENNEAADGDDEDGDEEGSASGDSGVGDLFSPDAIINFIIAGIFDILGLFPAINMVSAIIAGIYFLIWMLATGKKGWWKLLLALVCMFIPGVSDVADAVGWIGFILGYKLPTCWVGFVYSVVSGGDGIEKTAAPKLA